MAGREKIRVRVGERKAASVLGLVGEGGERERERERKEGERQRTEGGTELRRGRENGGTCGMAGREKIRVRASLERGRQLWFSVWRERERERKEGERQRTEGEAWARKWGTCGMAGREKTRVRASLERGRQLSFSVWWGGGSARAKKGAGREPKGAFKKTRVAKLRMEPAETTKSPPVKKCDGV